MDEQEQPSERIPPCRWFALPRVNAADWDQARQASIPPERDIHGEANFVMHFCAPSWSVLDAGCGTGRVGIELARRGVRVVGVDLDADMLAVARATGPALDWRQDDLTTVTLGCTFDIVLLAGNVMIVAAPGSEAAIVANMVGHLVAGGLLIAGFRTDREYFTLEDYDAATSEVGLQLIGRWATWEGEQWRADARFAVSVHQRPYDDIENSRRQNDRIDRH